MGGQLAMVVVAMALMWPWLSWPWLTLAMEVVAMASVAMRSHANLNPFKIRSFRNFDLKFGVYIVRLILVVPF